jgi:polysaccharide export outer membrane protein
VVDVQSLDLSSLAGEDVPSEQVHAGDVLDVTVVTGATGEIPERWPLRVAGGGTVNVPLVGVVPVAGKSLLAAEREIRLASIERGVYRQPTVATQLLKRRTNQVTVLGAVENPGTYSLPTADSHLLAALMAAGGLTQQADPTIEIRHPTFGDHDQPPPPGRPDQVALTSHSATSPERSGTTVQLVDLVEASGTPSAGGHPLRDGSVVTVATRPPRFVYVLGLVNRPSQLELPSNREMRVLDAIASAGGLSITIANKVYVIRRPAGTDESIVIKVSLRSAKMENEANIPLMAGDVVSVEETPATFAAGVVRQFFRVGLSSGIAF